MLGPRGRLVAGMIVGLLLVFVMWLAVVSPERSKASSLQAQIATERTTLAAEQAELSSGEQARSKYPSEVHALKVLLNAIPTSDQEPQLIELINALENDHVIDWTTTSISQGAAGGFAALTIGFSFKATYVDLQQFIAALDALNQSDGQNVVTKGRLVTVDALSLTPLVGQKASASVTVTVYMQPSTGAPVTTAAAGS
jgi:Tfp pilus assembly protein PilO